MTKSFNTAADCKPQIHYMVDITERLRQIRCMIDKGKYFTISRGRQYGKTVEIKIWRGNEYENQGVKQGTAVFAVPFPNQSCVDSL